MRDRLEDNRRRAVHAFPEQALGVGKVDLDAHRSGRGIFVFGHSRDGSREDLAPRASTANSAGSPTLVMTTSRSGTCTITRIKSVRLTVKSGV